jgi:hypothetical protein
VVAKSSVYPSAGEVATRVVPITPEAPERLSTTTCWPSAVPIPAASMRASASVAPPGATGTIRRMGLLGKDCA